VSTRTPFGRSFEVRGRIRLPNGSVRWENAQWQPRPLVLGAHNLWLTLSIFSILLMTMSLRKGEPYRFHSYQIIWLDAYGSHIRSFAWGVKSNKVLHTPFTSILHSPPHLTTHTSHLYLLSTIYNIDTEAVILSIENSLDSRLPRLILNSFTAFFSYVFLGYLKMESF